MPLPATPALTADIIIELLDRPDRPIVLIERRNPPHGWALPGGFVEVGETVERAAVREAREETTLVVTLTALLGVYSDPARDARGHTVSVVFVGQARGVPVAQSDTKGIVVFSLDQLPSRLAFDHARMLHDYAVYRREGRTPTPSAARL